MATNFPLVPPPQGGTPNLPQPGQPGPLRPDEFQSGSKANVTTFGFERIEPPSGLYLQRDDLILVEAFNNSTPVTVRFNLRFLRVPEPTGGQPSEGGVGRSPGGVFEHGIVETVTQDIVLAANSLTTGKTIQLAEGYLLGIGASTSPNVDLGQVFARAFICRGTGGFLTATTALFADYINGFGPAGWPYGRMLQPGAPPGFKHSQNWGAVAAGADLLFTLFTTQRLRIESFQAQFVASAAVANRNIQVVVDDGANVVYTGTAAVAVTAAQTAQVIGTSGSTQTGIIATNLMIPLPQPLVMTGAWRIRTLTQNIQAGDQWSAAFLNVEEWLGGN